MPAAPPLGSSPIRSFYLDENENHGLPADGPVQAGYSNQDDNSLVEDKFTLFTISPERSYLEYHCWLEVRLDPGMALHKPLPQVNPAPDTLASVLISPIDPDLEANVLGINTTSTGRFTDVIQRMATSTYFFILRGWALRAGYRIPIPGLKLVAGVPATPTNPQRASNTVVGNFSGIPLFLARWELWYLVALAPKAAQLPPPNVAQHVRPDQKPPMAIQVPWSQSDQNAIPTPIPDDKFFVGGG